MARCCGGASCSCLLVGGAHATVEGNGSSQDPFVISADVDLAVLDSSVFNLTLGGSGTEASPWTLSIAFATSASIDDLPDVDTAGKVNGDVLTWNSALSQWEAGPAAVVGPGAVLTDTSLDGDGSGGAPLEVLHDPDRFTTTTVDGIGLSDDGINATLRKFVDSTARAAASPSPDLNTISVLGTAPGVLDYWTGAAWEPVGQFGLDIVGELLAMSGSYTGAEQVTLMIRQVSLVTNVDGTFDALSVADLTGYAGVLAATFQPTGLLSYGAVLQGATNKIQGIAYQWLDGSVYGSQAITGVVTAWVY